METSPETLSYKDRKIRTTRANKSFTNQSWQKKEILQTPKDNNPKETVTISESGKRTYLEKGRARSDRHKTTESQETVNSPPNTTARQRTRTQAIGSEKRKIYHYGSRESKHCQNQATSGQNRLTTKDMEAIRIGSDYNTNKTRLNITNSKGLRNYQRPADAVMALYRNNIRQFVEIDPNKGIHSIRNGENARGRIDIDGNHTRNPIRRQEDTIATQVVCHIGIDNGAQTDLYKGHTKTIVIQIKHFIWIRIYIIDIISTPTFSILGSDIDEKSPHIGHPFALIPRRSALSTAAITPAIHQNHSDRHTYHQTMGRQPRTKRIGHEYKRKENGNQYSSYPGHDHHPLPRNTQYVTARGCYCQYWTWHICKA